MIKYVGPKPLFSKSGITFHQTKEDKFIYLHIALELLKAIDHEYHEARKYIHYIDDTQVSDEVLTLQIAQHCSDFQSLVDSANHTLEDVFEHERKHITESKILTPVEKEVCEKNLSMMHDYLLQRSINKKVYYCIIGQLANVIKKDLLDYIITPMNHPFVHILHSIQGVLAEQKYPIETTLEIYEENQTFFAKLIIGYVR